MTAASHGFAAAPDAAMEQIEMGSRIPSRWLFLVLAAVAASLYVQSAAASLYVQPAAARAPSAASDRCYTANSLAALAAGRHVLIGTAVAARLLDFDPAYRALIVGEFSQLEAENEMKWTATEPAPHTFQFAAADSLVAFAAHAGIAVRGHNLLWRSHNPRWLEDGNFTPAQLRDLMREHIETVARRYAGRVYAWDVVNEAFAGNGSVEHAIWYDRPGIGLPGTGYVEQAFKWAHAADPRAVLFYNDYDAEGLNAKSNAIYAMAKDFVARKVPLGGVGLQMHFSLSNFPPVADIEANMNRLAALGLQVQITELDVRLPVNSDGVASPADLDREAEIYRDVVAACLRQPRCTAVQTWGFTDRYSWIPHTYPGLGAALPFDAALRPKPAYWAMFEALGGTRPVFRPFIRTPPAAAPATNSTPN
jgi:endo-1,4-beta-xylanase